MICKFKVIKEIGEIDAELVHPDFKGLLLRTSKYYYCDVEIKTNNNKVNISQKEYPYWRKAQTNEEKEIIQHIKEQTNEILKFRNQALQTETKHYRINPRTERVELYSIETPHKWRWIGESHDGGAYYITPDEIQHDKHVLSNTHTSYIDTHLWIIQGWLLKQLFQD